MKQQVVPPETQKLIDELVLANLNLLRRQAQQQEFLGISPRVLAEDARLLGVEDVAEMLSRWLQRTSNITNFYDIMKSSGEGILVYERVQSVPSRDEIASHRRTYEESLKELYDFQVHSRPHLERAAEGDFNAAFELAEVEDDSDLRVEEVAAIRALKEFDSTMNRARERDPVYCREAPLRVLAIESGRRGDVDCTRRLLDLLNGPEGGEWHRSRAIALGLGGWEPWQYYPLVHGSARET